MGNPTEDEVMKWTTDLIRVMAAAGLTVATGGVATPAVVDAVQNRSDGADSNLPPLRPGHATFVKNSRGPFVEIVENHPNDPKVKVPESETADPTVEVYDRETKEKLAMIRSEVMKSERYIDNAVDVLAAASPGNIWTLDERTVTLVFTSKKGLKYTVMLTDIDLSSKGQAIQFVRKGGYIYPVRSDGSDLLDESNTPRLVFAAKYVHERIAKARIARLEAANLVFSFQIALAQLAGSAGPPTLPGFKGGTLRTPSVPRGQSGATTGVKTPTKPPTAGGAPKNAPASNPPPPPKPPTPAPTKARVTSAPPASPKAPAKPATSGSQSGAPGGGAAVQDRGRLFAKPTKTGTTALKAGEGRTDKFGNVEYSTLGSPKDVALAKNHEAVHSFLSPKFKLFRNLRADFAMAGYNRSAILKYIEEALAEVFAQLKVNGIKGLPTGIKFPIKEGYVTIQRLVAEGAVGTIVVGGITYYVFYDSE
jgi:hypothetical protein